MYNRPHKDVFKIMLLGLEERCINYLHLPVCSIVCISAKVLFLVSGTKNTAKTTLKTANIAKIKKVSPIPINSRRIPKSFVTPKLTTKKKTIDEAIKTDFTS
jgi:hypothetical protein